jgi:signal transduction histidine kinase
VLNNILRYAKAKSVIATLHYSPESFTLEITDDGIGFEVHRELERSAEKVSTGLINIYKRARMIDGNVLIDSQPGKGTRFIITIPHIQKQGNQHDSFY